MSIAHPLTAAIDSSPIMSVPGAACPTCGRFALVEPGGVRCLEGGHLALFRRILPKSTTGHDRANRIRQQALDRAFISPGRGGTIPIDMLIALEGRGKGDDDAT